MLPIPAFILAARVFAADSLLEAYYESLMNYQENQFPDDAFNMPFLRDEKEIDAIYSRPYVQRYSGYDFEGSELSTEYSHEDRKYQVPDIIKIQFKYTDLSPEVHYLASVISLSDGLLPDQVYKIVSQTETQADPNTAVSFILRVARSGSMPISDMHDMSDFNFIDVYKNITVDMDAFNGTCVRTGMKGRLCEQSCELKHRGTYDRFDRLTRVLSR
ncbi:hypothetical protein MIR68_009100 [Amoeboaphelidium protococcarum]|nr:hypothetical protein MIR68_009100 [Amoeboaphelidium protococcarum]